LTLLLSELAPPLVLELLLPEDVLLESETPELLAPLGALPVAVLLSLMLGISPPEPPDELLDELLESVYVLLRIHQIIERSAIA
jgi:hypothetical protein